MGNVTQDTAKIVPYQDHAIQRPFIHVSSGIAAKMRRGPKHVLDDMAERYQLRRECG